MDKKFSQDVTIPCYQTDVNGRLKPAAFMDMMQDMAYLAATELGFGYEALQTHHTAWVLSRMHFTFDNPPSWRDRVHMETWHKGLDGLLFLRDFLLLDDSGKVRLSCTSSWIVIDVTTRRLVRSDSLGGIVAEDTQCHEDAIATPAPKLAMPRDAQVEKVSERKVTFSDVDLNGHVNNVRYVVWATDCLPYELMEQGRLSDVVINFNREILPGETVELYMATSEQDDRMLYYIEGKVDSRQAFITELSIRK